MQTESIAALNNGSILYYLVVVVQARSDYGGKMLETMREVRLIKHRPAYPRYYLLL